MLDPIFDMLKAIIALIASLPGRILAALRRLVSIGPASLPDGTVRRFRHLKWFAKITAVAIVVLYMGPLLWHALWIRGYDLNYPAAVVRASNMQAANDSTTVQQGTKDTRTCDRSQLVDMEIKLIDFMVNENGWVPAMPQFKLGFFNLVKWQDTPFLDNKAAFQHGVLFAVRRTAVELSDVIGRVRGTSAVDDDLQNARGGLQYDSETWWINPLDDSRPFGPVQPASTAYRKSIELFERYNKRLGECTAVLDARADNLRSFFDRIANDLGSVADGLTKRSMGERYDPRTDEYVEGEGNDRGWFDMRADNLFHEASGTMYAYHGILQAARKDFADVIKTRQLDDVWDRLERNVAEAAALDPLIVANGKRDGFLIPDHLAVMAENVLRARANVTEIGDILDR
jgi:hypothetical protein